MKSIKLNFTLALFTKCIQKIKGVKFMGGREEFEFKHKNTQKQKKCLSVLGAQNNAIHDNYRVKVSYRDRIIYSN